MANITKRGDNYRITVYCGRDVNRKIIRRTITWKPDKKYTEKQLEKEVQRQATLFEEKVLSGQVSNGGNMRLVDFIPQYLENIKAEVAETTYKNYTRIIDTLIVPALGHLKLKDIKPLHIQKFVNSLCDVEANGKNGKTLKPATVQRYYVVLQSIMHNAYRLELIPSNPADSAKSKLPSIGEQKTEIYDREELAEMLTALEDEPLQFQCLIHLAIITGCRRGELVALEWSDINFSSGTITVSKSAFIRKGQPPGIKDTKSHKTRKVSVSPYCLEMLQHLRTEQSEKRLKLGTAWNGDNWVFIQDNGLMMYPSSPTLMFSDFLKKHNLPHRKFHSLRHTSATLSLISGVNIKTVASRLGHSQMKTTDRYVHAIEEADRQASDALGGFIQSLQAGNPKNRSAITLSEIDERKQKKA